MSRAPARSRGGASLGAGLPAVAIDRVLGVAKAYTTSVGAGPLPTEMDDADGERLRERGAEYGTSTGAPAALWLVRRGGGPLQRAAGRLPASR